MSSDRAIERSIDTLQRIYAVIVALAMNESLKRIFLKSGAGDLDVHFAHLPELLAFFFTAVPFVHGMNRHLDQTLAVSREPGKRWYLGYLLIDFLVFLGESCLLFLLAVSVNDPLFFKLLLGLLVLDVVWSLLTWPITKAVVAQWLIINLIAVVVGGLLIWRFPSIPEAPRQWILMSVAILRTIADYWFARKFYFPADEKKQPDSVPAPV
jgi:hypothetical protein